MLLNPDRMTMNYTMTDLVRTCTALACVACALLRDRQYNPSARAECFRTFTGSDVCPCLAPCPPLHDWICLCSILPMTCE